MCPFLQLFSGPELKLNRALCIVIHGGEMSNCIGKDYKQEEDCIIFHWQPSSRKSRVFDPGGSTLNLTLFLETLIQELSNAEAGYRQPFPFNTHPLCIHPLEQLEPVLVLSILWWAGWIDQLADLSYYIRAESIASTNFTGTHVRFRKPGFRIDLIFQSIASILIIKTFKTNYSIYRFTLRRAFKPILATHRWFDFNVASARITGHLYHLEERVEDSIRVFTFVIRQHSSSVIRPSSSYASAPALIDSSCWWRSSSPGVLDSSHWFRPEELDNNSSRVFFIGHPTTPTPHFNPPKNLLGRRQHPLTAPRGSMSGIMRRRRGQSVLLGPVGTKM